MQLGARVFGVLAGLMLLLLAIGYLLPRSWEAEAGALLPGPPSEIFALLSRPAEWPRWVSFPEEGSRRFGPEQGVGSGFRWDDPVYGKGEFRIVSVIEGRELDYEVLVEDGTLKIEGSIFLLEEGAGTRIRWVETGDFGWNPLMGFVALRMSESQQRALQAALERLREIVGE